MILNRNSFFLVLFAIFVLPLPLYKLIWIATTEKTLGTMYFTGHGNLGSVLGTSTYPVVWFKSGNDTIYFNGNVNIPLKDGEPVSVRFKKNDPSDAKINEFYSIWGDTLAYSTGPFLIFWVIFFHPDLIPKTSRILLMRRKPWLKIV